MVYAISTNRIMNFWNVVKQYLPSEALTSGYNNYDSHDLERKLKQTIYPLDLREKYGHLSSKEIIELTFQV